MLGDRADSGGDVGNQEGRNRSTGGDRRGKWPSPRWLLLFVVVVVALLVVWWASLRLLFGPDMATRGQFGDLFGGVNALFTGLAFAGLIYTILLQRSDLEMQREELELTREELKRSAEAQIGSQEALAEQVKLLQESARKQDITKRAEIFIAMRARLRDDPSFKNICELLENDDPRLRDVSLVERDRFVSFFEELALMRNSGFVNDQVALYMFGYFAVRCFESENFWDGLNREHSLWALFWDFARQMQEVEQNFRYEGKKFQL